MFENARCLESGREAEYEKDGYGVRIPHCPEHGSVFG